MPEVMRGSGKQPAPHEVRNNVAGTVLGPMVQAGTIRDVHFHHAAAAGLPPPNQLPRRPRMVDREAAIAALNSFRDQASESATMAVITGVPGVGKTALALAWAHMLGPEYPGGQLYADLHSDMATVGGLQPETVLGDFLYALGVPTEMIPGGLARRVGLYRTLTQDRPLLIVLDNALSTDQVRLLLPASPTSLTVITSRRRLTGLHLEGARALQLDPLEPEAALALITDTLGTERVAAEPQAAMGLVELCTGHPLALSIAAAQLAAHPNRPLADMVTALTGEQRRIATLSIGENMAVRSALDHTYGTLAPKAARLYGLLGLVPGDTVTVPAVAALAQIPRGQAEHLLGVLTDVNLLTDVAAGRYRFGHALIRLHAHELAGSQLTDQVREAARRRLFGWYLDTAARAERVLRPYRSGLVRDAERPPTEPVDFTDRALALEWFEAERGNLAAAIKTAHDRGRHATAWQLADAMWPLYLHRGHHTDRLQIEEVGLDAARADGNRYAEAKMWNRIGLSEHHLGRHVQAADDFTKARALWEELGEHGRAAGSLRRLGWVTAALGDHGKAIASFTAASDIYNRLGEDRETALALVDLADVLIATDQAGDALVHLDRARGLLADIDDAHNQARACMMAGRAHLAAGHPGNAAAELHAALKTMTRLGSDIGRAEVLEALGELGERTGHTITALARYEQALEALGETETIAHARIRRRIDQLADHPAPQAQKRRPKENT